MLVGEEVWQGSTKPARGGRAGGWLRNEGGSWPWRRHGRHLNERPHVVPVGGQRQRVGTERRAGTGSTCWSHSLGTDGRCVSGPPGAGTWAEGGAWKGGSRQRRVETGRGRMAATNGKGQHAPNMHVVTQCSFEGKQTLMLDLRAGPWGGALPAKPWAAAGRASARLGAAAVSWLCFLSRWPQSPHPPRGLQGGG